MFDSQPQIDGISFDNDNDDDCQLFDRGFSDFIISLHILNFSGTTKIRNLDDNIGTLMVKLSEEDLKELSDAVPFDMVSGSRDYDLISQFTWKNSDTPAKNDYA